MTEKYTVEKHTTVEYIIISHKEPGIKEPVAKCNSEAIALMLKSLIEAFEEEGNHRPLESELAGACEKARDMYDELAMGKLELAAKYGPDYTPLTDDDLLAVRDKLEQALEKYKGRK